MKAAAAGIAKRFERDQRVVGAMSKKERPRRTRRGVSEAKWAEQVSKSDIEILQDARTFQ